jgi:NAD(P)H-dependent FMN reductase
MIRIAVVVGSTRPGRRARAVADWVAERAGSHPELILDVVDLADHDLPNLTEATPAIAGRYTREATRAWSRVIDSYDGYVIVTPEYNHGPSGALKNALDHLYGEWADKAVGFVSYGVDGGQRAVEQLRLVVAELGMASVRSQVALSLRTDFDPQGRPMPVAGPDGLDRMLGQLVDWSRALRPLRVRESV